MEAKKPLELVLEPEVYAQLSYLSETTGASMNRLVAEAIQAYAAQLSAHLDTHMQESLRRLRAYAASPRNLERDTKSFIEAEASYPDPMEATRVSYSVEQDSSPATDAEREIVEIVGGLG